MTTFIRVNINKCRYYVYALNGLLLKRHCFYETKLRYGDPICTSNNGRYFVFYRRPIFLR